MPSILLSLIVSVGCGPASGDPPPGDAVATDAPESGPAGDGGGGSDATTGMDAGRPPPPSDAGPGERLVVVADGTGIRRLLWDGADLFAGVGGYYIIGSCTGADDANNVTSQGSDGRTLRSPGSCPGAPFRMEISGTDPIRVSIEVGPLPADYRTLSVPLDPVKSLFDELAFDGTRYQVGCGLSWSDREGSSATFASIPTPCHIPGAGDVGVARVVPPGEWGEISGPLAVVRRRIVSGDARELDFYNHPGTNNIEIGWNSDFRSVLPAGTVVRLEEEITVREGRGVPPGRTWTFEAEGPEMGHGVGRAEADGWSAGTSDDDAGYLCYGPYVADVPAGAFDARFRLMIDDHRADSLAVVRIEVSDYGGREGGCGDCILARRDIRRTDFDAAGVYQDFPLRFTSPGLGHPLELRTYWMDRAYIRQDRVDLVPGP